MDKVREAILNGDAAGAAKAYLESKNIGHDIIPLQLSPQLEWFAVQLIENHCDGDIKRIREVIGNVLLELDCFDLHAAWVKAERKYEK